MKVSEIQEFERRLSGNKTFKLKRFIKSIVQRAVNFLITLIQRLFEIVLSLLILLTFGLVIFICLIIRKLITGKDIFISQNIIGRKAVKLTIKYFNCKSYVLKNISLFYYVMMNKMAVTGISVRSYEDSHRELGDAYIYNSKPGVFTLWYVRKSARVIHDGQFGTEWEYVFRRSVVGDILIILKSIPAMFYYFDPSFCRDKVNIFDLYFDNLTMDQALEKLDQALSSKTKKKVYFVNPDCLNKIFDDKEYFEVLRKSDYVFPDGIGVNIACKILKDPLLANINGTDMLPFLCELARDRKYSIFLLGGKPGVAEKMKLNLEGKFAGLKIAGCQDGYFDRVKDKDRIIGMINNSGADILLVAFGAPLQEKWIDSNKALLNPKVQMGVGGLFDFYSGNIRRAPKWMREVGLEWVYRLMQEPKRMWKRYIIGNPVFIFRVLKWKFSLKKDN